MNVYEVISETLWDYVLDYGEDEPHCIAELIAAKNPSQARYIAWKIDDDFTYDLNEMPKFSVHLRRKNVSGLEVDIVSNLEEYPSCWR